MNPHLEDAISDRRAIAKVSLFDRADTGKDAGLPDRVAQFLQPRIELGGAYESIHELIVSIWIQACQAVMEVGYKPRVLPWLHEQYLQRGHISGARLVPERPFFDIRHGCYSQAKYKKQ